MDVEKTIELITVRLQQVAQLQFELAERQSRQEETVSHLVTAVGRLSGDLQSFAQRTEERFQEMAQRMEHGFQELREAQQHTDQRMERGFQELREAQQHTDENLNALIKIVDELIRRDGRPR